MPVPSWSVTKSLKLLAARKLVLLSCSWQPEVSETNLITMIHFHWIFAANFSSLCVVVMVVVVCVTFVFSLLSWCSYHVGGVYFINSFCLFVMTTSILKTNGKLEKSVYCSRNLNTIIMDFNDVVSTKYS